MSWELAVWRRRERMVVEMVMLVVMIVRGGLLLCLQHSIPGAYNLQVQPQRHDYKLNIIKECFI